jgi:hypothetical protein
MSDKRCPNETELLSFVDADLPPEQLARIEKHLELCSACAKEVMAFSALAADIAAPLPLELPFDAAAHVAAVMQRLDTRVAAPRGARLLAWCGALAAAAVVLLLLAKLNGSAQDGELGGSKGELAARGGPAVASLSRDVGVQLYAQQEPLRALSGGSQIGVKTALTAGLRNVSNERAYLLLFAVDAERAVHWIAPEYASASSNPEAFAIVPASGERLLPSAAVFDDLALGELRIVSLISKTRLHVSDIERLPPSELGTEALLKRFSGAEVREILLDVR